MLTSYNPTTGDRITSYSTPSDEDIDLLLEKSQRAFCLWSAMSFNERAKLMRAVADQLREQKAELAHLMAIEMGKPVREGEPEVDKAAWCAEHYAEYAEDYLQPDVLVSDASRSYVSYEPLGSVLGILPWNAPAWLAFRFLAPALMAGNTCIMKHDPHVAGCASAIADAFVKVGMPPGVMINLPLETERVAEVIRDKRIAAVSFTGSSVGGSKVAAIAASELKPAVLELGGSDPCLVFADADLEKAADIAVLSRIINAGQSCIAAKRILVEKAIYSDFIGMLEMRLRKLQVGDPLAESTDVGPIARADLRDNLHRQVRETVNAGATCLMGGELNASQGFFYPVTLLTDVTPKMCAFREETFGPVMCVTPFDDADQALALANDTDYGLGAGVWTENQALAEKLARDIQAGQVAINGIVKTDPRLPSGGIKRSGYGRELGPHGIKEFVNAKQVWVR